MIEFLNDLAAYMEIAPFWDRFVISCIFVGIAYVIGRVVYGWLMFPYIIAKAIRKLRDNK